MFHVEQNQERKKIMGIHFVKSNNPLVVPLKVGTVVTKGAVSFLLRGDGQTIARVDSGERTRQLFQVAISKGMKMVNLTSPKGQQILANFH